MTDSSESSGSPLFLGFDFSTQSLKATTIDRDLKTVYETSINFERDLPEFQTTAGVHHSPDGLTVTSPPIMWVAAFDLLLDRMKADGFAFDRVEGISGSGQQHGSVYWSDGSNWALTNLNSEKSLRENLESRFSIGDSPVWMDSSTTAQCQDLENALGGPQATAELTGSRAYERFTGNQIAKIAQTKPEGYNQTERIQLVSSFAASLFLGDYAPIDASDGSGMNLMDIRSRDWADAAVLACGEGLGGKLGEIVPSHASVGTVHAYFVQKFGFQEHCRIIAFSGDNPCSLAGLRLQRPGEIAISLGTSDTVFAALSEPSPSASEGHIFASPVDPDGYMALVCYKNGSMTREDIRNRCAAGSWEEFNGALDQTPPGNEGRIGFYRKEPEITPPILTTGANRFDADDQAVESFPDAAEIRAVVEGQFLSMRLHGKNIGIEASKILATGGASANPAILQVIADVFGVDVYTADQPNSASLGAAYRALHGSGCAARGEFIPFADALTGAPAMSIAARPNAEAHEIYAGALERYARLEAGLIKSA
jgi:xylulokinase